MKIKQKQDWWNKTEMKQRKQKWQMYSRISYSGIHNPCADIQENYYADIQRLLFVFSDFLYRYITEQYLSRFSAISLWNLLK